MTRMDLLTRETLRTPKAAAIAGMLFSLLTVAVFWLLWNSVPADPQESYYIRWSFFLFPLWVFLMSIHILTDNLLRPKGLPRPR